MGKFLYNKRIDPWDRANPRTMEYRDMKKFKVKPKFYENHEQIIKSTLMEPNQMSLYLYENMLSHFGDIGDVAETLDVYSAVEGPKERIDYEMVGNHVSYELTMQAAIVEAMAVTEFNEHMNTKDRKMLQIQVPQIYECNRNSKIAKDMIN